MKNEKKKKKKRKKKKKWRKKTFNAKASASALSLANLLASSGSKYELEEISNNKSCNCLSKNGKKKRR